MNFDWYMDSDHSSPDDINNCVEGRNKFDKVINVFSRTKLLATCLKSDKLKSYAKSGDKSNDPGGHKLLIYGKMYDELIKKEIARLKMLGLDKPLNNISMPKCSFFLQFSFTLAAPYISRDDEEFYICDNPIRKDKVFKVPMVSGSSWKGNMRWTAMKIFTDGLPEVIDQNNISQHFDARARIVRLFGHEKSTIADYLDSVLAEAISGDDKSHEKFIENKKFVKERFNKFLVEKGYINTNVDGRRGRLNFYPTFFNKISLEVINPHDRTTKAGTQPIYIESVPEGADGIFSLLYIPFDLMGKPEHKAKKEMAEDLELSCIALKEMMRTYGFSAKKSSGFGIAKNDLSDVFCEMNGIEIKKSPKKDIKQKPKNMSFNDFKAMGRHQILKETGTGEQNTFDSLENKIKAIIARLLNTATPYSGGNNV